MSQTNTSPAGGRTHSRKRVIHQEPTNEERADRAAAAVDQYKRCYYGAVYQPDAEELLGNFLTDVLHLCTREGWDFEERLESARLTHAEEK
jgi:hypothetical protein